MDELELKIDKLIEFGYFEINDEYIKEYCIENLKDNARAIEKFKNKNYIVARKIDGLIIFYSKQYINDKSIEELKRIPLWME
ncbi:hypothetical protein [Romboutsia sp. 1001713B170207_170306_H8]|uniref:hypothetical protein n=1 Tax=Romboutsia sp. 1001713B170207_170306_H8 TaxID=2787112 RepID=UPI00189A27B2|nr:hypothetical protein [Romboutsia sp. 1001713B170207_170306_H8]